MKSKASKSIRITNRRAGFHFDILTHLQVGIVLKGTEVKSIRAGKASISEAYCYFKGNDLYIRNMYIAPYTHAGAQAQHDSYANRRLLLQKTESRKWHKKFKEKGVSIVPEQLFFSPKGWAKLRIGLAKGRKRYDKRERIKERESQRSLSRLMKKRG